MIRFRLCVVLKKYLASIGMTPYQLGKLVPDVSAQTVYAICAGTRRPSLDVLESILSALRRAGFETQLEDLLQIEGGRDESATEVG